MPTSTRTGRPAMRTGRTSGAGQGRFARATAGGTARSQGLRRRKPPEPTGMKKVLSAVLPSAAAKKAAPSSKKGKAGGLALVAAAAGMAIKNRGKLSQMRHKGTGADTSPATTPTSVNTTPVPPSAPPL